MSYQFLLDGLFIRDPEGGNGPKKKFSSCVLGGGSPFSKSSYPQEINFLKKTGPDEGLLQTNYSTFLIVFWLSNERV